MAGYDWKGEGFTVGDPIPASYVLRIGRFEARIETRFGRARGHWLCWKPLFEHTPLSENFEEAKTQAWTLIVRELRIIHAGMMELKH